MEKNDPKLIELVILPMKVFGAKDLDRLSHAIGKSVFYTSSVDVYRCYFHYVSRCGMVGCAFISLLM